RGQMRPGLLGRVFLEQSADGPGRPADLLLEGFGGAGQPDGVRVAPLPRRQEGQIGECDADPRAVVDLPEQLQGLEGCRPRVLPVAYAAVSEGQPQQVEGE